jgi:hypothetical protein
MTETVPDIGGPAEQEKNISVTFYIPAGLRNRARAAYRATSIFEADASLSDLVRKAIVAEVERREREHNRGAVFVGDDQPLRPGRPTGSG